MACAVCKTTRRGLRPVGRYWQEILCADCSDRPACHSCCRREGVIVDSRVCVCQSCRSFGLCSTQIDLTRTATLALDFLDQTLGIYFTKDLLNMQKRLHSDSDYDDHETNKYALKEFCEPLVRRVLPLLPSAISTTLTDSFWLAPLEATQRSACRVSDAEVSKALRVSLVDSPQVSIRNQVIYGRTQIRFASYEKTTGQQSRETYVGGVKIASNLPFPRAVAVLAHEFIHAWIHLTRGLNHTIVDRRWFNAKPPNQLSIQADKFEEGLCIASSIQYLMARWEKWPVTRLDQREVIKFWIHHQNSTAFLAEVRTAEKHVKRTSWTVAIQCIALTGTYGTNGDLIRLLRKQEGQQRNQQAARKTLHNGQTWPALSTYSS